MKKLFIIAALMIATGVYARQQPTPSYAQRAIDANSPEGMRLQNRYWGPTLPPWQPPQDVNINLTGHPEGNEKYYEKLVNSKDYPCYIPAKAKLAYRQFTKEGVLCSFTESNDYIFISASNIKNLQDAVKGQYVPYNTGGGWNLYSSGVIYIKGKKYPMYYLKDPKAGKTANVPKVQEGKK